MTKRHRYSCLKGECDICEATDRHARAVARAEQACVQEIRHIYNGHRELCECQACVCWRTLLAARARAKVKKGARS